ncbi:MAG: GNAT family N-acetyltransferase [Calditrichales bacterium]|nr:MAG: GNAT family N-acetyltransferase [Calditrichales bacterium]
MSKNRIEIIKIKLKDLDAFARVALTDPAFSDITPISRIRARSQTKNPHGAPNDLALIVALYDNRCVGYHGLLPGLLKNINGYSKIYWLVTFYLNTAFRGKGYGKRLVIEIQQTNVDLVTTGISASAEGVYKSTGFKQLGELPYYQLRPESIHFLDTFLQDLKSTEKQFKSKAVQQLSEELKPAAAQQAQMVSFQRDIDTINWMIRNPWIVSMQEDQRDAENYYFSTVRDLFKFVPLEIFATDENTRKGFLVLSISRKKNKTTIKILDNFFYDPQDSYIVGYFAIKFAKEYLADIIEYPAGYGNYFRNHTGLKRLEKRKKRLYLFCPRSNDSPLASLSGEIQLNYCDSDTAFT